MRKHGILLILFSAVFSRVLSKLSMMNDNDCWERRNVSIAVDDLPALYKHFSACLEKCRELKGHHQRIAVTSHLKSSVAVLRELYYRGGISFSMVQKYNDLYGKARDSCSALPKPVPNWLIIKYESVPASYDMDLMLIKDDKHICNELIIVSKELGRYGVSQLIPIPSFDNDINPRFVILPYKNNFIVRINDTHEDTALYKIYYESMKCMNIINTNPIKVHFLNKRFKRWIKNIVIPASKSIPDTVSGFGAIYRISCLAEEFEKKMRTNYEFFNKPLSLNDEIINGYPSMTLGLMENKYKENNVQILGILKNIHLMELILIILVTCIIVISLLAFYVFDKKWKFISNLIPEFELDLNDVSDDETKKECNNEEIKINGSNRNHDNDGVKDVPVVDRKISSYSSHDTCNDSSFITIDSEISNISSTSDFRCKPIFRNSI